MDAAGRALRHAAGEHDEQVKLRLRRAPGRFQGSAADAVLDTFLGVDAPELEPEPPAPVQSVAPVSRPGPARTASNHDHDVRPLPLSVPGAPGIQIGVDRDGRICLVANVPDHSGAAIGVAIGELDVAEAWVLSSPDAIFNVAAGRRLDLGRGVRRMVEMEVGATAVALRRAGIEVKSDKAIKG